MEIPASRARWSVSLLPRRLGLGPCKPTRLGMTRGLWGDRGFYGLGKGGEDTDGGWISQGLMEGVSGKERCSDKNGVLSVLGCRKSPMRGLQRGGRGTQPLGNPSEC